MMMKTKSMIVHGINAIMVEAEVNVSRGLPYCAVVGYGNTIVKEAILRIRSAIESSGLEYPLSRITFNLAPADIPKRGSQMELAMAVALLAATGQVFDGSLDNTCFVGELSLDGKINGCKGILAILMEAKKRKIVNVIIPRENEAEARIIDGLNIFVCDKLIEVVDFLNKKIELKKISHTEEHLNENIFAKDFIDIKGQESAKRAILIAVAGGHPLLMIGSPGTGKSMLAERIPSIMPKLDCNRIIESSIIHSISQENAERGLIATPPFRRPSTNISLTGLLGSGYPPRPGEVTMAHNGILFLDEISEMNKNVIDALRIPLDRKCVSLSKRGETFIYPADFLLISCANPCKCGYLFSKKRRCTCTHGEIASYRAKISGAISDRIDIQINVSEPDYETLYDNGLSSLQMRELVNRARQIQKKRYINEIFNLNSNILDNKLNHYCKFENEGEAFLRDAYKKLSLSLRAVVKIRKLSRTIADLDGSSEIKTVHISEAIQYRQR